jgi:hypothetical protein
MSPPAVVERGSFLMRAPRLPDQRITASTILYEIFFVLRNVF